MFLTNKKKAETVDIYNRVVEHINEYNAHRIKGCTNVGIKIDREITKRIHYNSVNINNNLNENSEISDNIGEVMIKNIVLQPKQNDENDNYINLYKRDNSIPREYLQGTSIYFGATIALKGHHGGYLSYKNVNLIRGSAHKILSTTRLVISNADNISDSSLIKYGDAVWLQAGDFAVLGAYYDTRQVNGKIDQSTRQIKPGLINCRRENHYKAQQYGRWIILNAQDPIDLIGKPVLHLDNVLFEQEWYYLSSKTPYDSNMYKIEYNLDSTINYNYKLLFYPGDHCNWKICLVDVPKESKIYEKTRQKLLHMATNQLEISKYVRLQKIQKISYNSDINMKTDLLKYNKNIIFEEKINDLFTFNHLLNIYHK